MRNHFIPKSAIFAFFISIPFFMQSQTQPKPDALIQTEFGTIKIRLYDDCPGHKANFLKLAKEGAYDSTTFHRVISGFMIQGGDPNTKLIASRGNGGQGGPGYTQPAEIKPHHFHTKGAIAAARTSDQVNPNRESSGSQFYIVQGKPITEEELNFFEGNISKDMENNRFKTWLEEPAQAWIKAIDFNKLQQENPDSIQKLNEKASGDYFAKYPPMQYKFPPQQRDLYKQVGGTPSLDMQYTVFGEVLEGLDVLDKIAAVKTQPGDRPEKDVFMKVIIP